MFDKRLRERIACEAARLLYLRQEQDYVRAKRKAARQLGVRFRPEDLPANREIRDQLQRLTNALVSDAPAWPPRRIALEVLRIMRRLRPLQPRCLDRFVDEGEIQVFAPDVPTVIQQLGDAAKNITNEGIRAIYGADAACAVLRFPEVPVRLLVFSAPDFHAQLLSEDGKNLETLSLDGLQTQVAGADPRGDVDALLDGIDPGSDRFEVFRFLLEQLESVQQPGGTHPEGDALYHSLQVFDLALAERPYDEEFLTAALLHDVGKAADTHNPTTATLSLLDGLITHRTRWFIAHRHDATRYRTRELPPRQRQALRESDDFEELLLFEQIDQMGRKPGVKSSSVDDAVEYLRSLENGSCWET